MPELLCVIITHLKYFIQPATILDISCKSDSKSIYFFFSIIFNSWVILINLFKISTFIPAEFNIGSLLFFDSKAAVIVKDIISRQIFSIFK